MSEHTREFCSRQGRELMSSVLAQHPGVFSALLQKTADSIKHVGRVRTVTSVCMWVLCTSTLMVLYCILHEYALPLIMCVVYECIDCRKVCSEWVRLKISGEFEDHVRAQITSHGLC